jgi:hypothetical protein
MSFLSDSSLPSSSASTQSGSYSRGRLNKDSTISTFTADETLMGEETQSIISEPASIVDSGNSTKTQLSKGTKKAEDVGNFFERYILTYSYHF